MTTLIVAAVAAVAFSLIGCDDMNVVPESTPERPTLATTWEAYGAGMEEGERLYVIDLNSDGTYTSSHRVSASVIPESGTWDYDGQTVTIDADGQPIEIPLPSQTVDHFCAIRDRLGDCSIEWQRHGHSH